MGIFSNDDKGQPRHLRGAVKEHETVAGIGLQVPCDRCHVALAKVEVITAAGPVFSVPAPSPGAPHIDNRGRTPDS